MDRIQHPSATAGHLFTEGNPGGGVPGTTVTASWLNGVQEELIAIIVAAGLTPSAATLNQVKAALDILYPVAPVAAGLTAEIAARTAADTAEATARANADTAEALARGNADAALDTRLDALETALPLQQSNAIALSGVDAVFGTASPVVEAGILGNYQLLAHRNAAGQVIDAALDLNWSTVYADTGACGWAFSATTGTLGAELAALLRTLWGIDVDDEWPHPNLYGELIVEAQRFIVSLYRQTGGTLGFAIVGGLPTATTLSRGCLHVRIPPPVYA